MLVKIKKRATEVFSDAFQKTAAIVASSFKVEMFGAL